VEVFPWLFELEGGHVGHRRSFKKMLSLSHDHLNDQVARRGYRASERFGDWMCLKGSVQ
jgi:hypothetical protein